MRRVLSNQPEAEPSRSADPIDGAHHDRGHMAHSPDVRPSKSNAKQTPRLHRCREHAFCVTVVEVRNGA